MTDAQESPVLVLPHPSVPHTKILRLNRPKALNSLNAAMTEAFIPAARELANDASLRVLIVEGSGEHFMAGGDIKGFAETLNHPGADRERHFLDLIHRLHGAIELMQRMDAITIARVRGACAGFGLSLAIGCDLTLASEDAYFTSAYKAIGLTPDGGQSYFLPRIVGLKKALELTLLSERLNAQEALALGLVNRVVPAGELDSAVDQMAERIAESARGAMRGAKRLLTTSLAQTMSMQLAAEAESFARCAAQDDFAEGIRAFIEKRPARFA